MRRRDARDQPPPLQRCLEVLLQICTNRGRLAEAPSGRAHPQHRGNQTRTTKIVKYAPMYPPKTDAGKRKRFVTEALALRYLYARHQQLLKNRRRRPLCTNSLHLSLKKTSGRRDSFDNTVPCVQPKDALFCSVIEHVSSHRNMKGSFSRWHRTRDTTASLLRI